MRLDNEFEVPRPIDEAWAVLTDVEKIAPCLPGAQLTEVEGETYHGFVKVKVGPVVAQYTGQAHFKELDAATHHAVLEAKGKERSGRGIASAVVNADLTDQGDTTRVTVGTDLTISGPLAQFGRGAIVEVSTKLLNQFVECLRETVLETGGARGGGVVPEAGAVAAGPVPGAPTPPQPSVSPEQAPAAEPAQAASGRRAVQGPSAEPADLLSMARGPILKRLIPLAILVAVVIVLIVWLV